MAYCVYYERFNVERWIYIYMAYEHPRFWADVELILAGLKDSVNDR